ncbi:hypothetical protein BRADI_3g57766v3 [Brachypodium distachyon]|uniref:Secreted protein n=1 Tax=Brachypodium distachyon TaxID=15368 RepID=A0A2K2D5K5_BRADI|nr:hypothetical protein BRADI_3g57766v3 [Brachypodium distachyon]
MRVTLAGLALALPCGQGRPWNGCGSAIVFGCWSAQRPVSFFVFDRSYSLLLLELVVHACSAGSFGGKRCYML